MAVLAAAMPAARAEQAGDDSAALLARGKAMTALSQPCPVPDPGEVPTEITVCGKSDTAQQRLTEEERRLVGARQARGMVPDAPDPHSIHPGEDRVGQTRVARLPHNWIGQKGRLYVPPAVNPVHEHVRAMEAARRVAAEQDADALPSPG